MAPHCPRLRRHGHLRCEVLTKKIIFLTLALLFPVVVFVFLKIFGRNEFRVPLMHQKGKIDPPENCDFSYRIPYTTPDSLIDILNLKTKDSLYLFYFDPSINSAMKRVSTAATWLPVRIVDPSAFPRGTDLRIIKQCVLLMEPPASVALVDHKNRIRGYYDGSDRDEVDRLLVEIEIILKQ